MLSHPLKKDVRYSWRLTLAYHQLSLISDQTATVKYTDVHQKCGFAIWCGYLLFEYTLKTPFLVAQLKLFYIIECMIWIDLIHAILKQWNSVSGWIYVINP